MNFFRYFTQFTLIACLSIIMTTRSGDTPYSINSEPAHHSLTRFLTSADLEDDASKWGVYTDGMGNPTWVLSNASALSQDGLSLRCAITGGDPYSNVHCYRNLPAVPTSQRFILSMSFYYQPASTFNNAGGDSIVQALEFTMSKWDRGLRYEWALQWDNVDTGGPKWRYWGHPMQMSESEKELDWVDLGISGSISGEQWHTLVLEGDILDNKVHYLRFILDGQEHLLNVPLIAPASTPGELDRFAVAVQLDGNYKEIPYDVFIDRVSLGMSPTFVDVGTDYWAYDFIERLYNAGITGGCTSSPLNYCPESEVTRAQMAVFLEKGMHYPVSFNAPNVTPTFNDTISHWAEDWIEALKSDGITSGCDADLYCPEAPVTRAQMAVFLLRAKHGSTYKPPAVGVNTGFGDISTDYWAAAWIKQLVAEGITSGCGSGNYCPDAPVTRAQMAVFLVKTFNLP